MGRAPPEPVPRLHRPRPSPPSVGLRLLPLRRNGAGVHVPLLQPELLRGWRGAGPEAGRRGYGRPAVRGLGRGARGGTAAVGIVPEQAADRGGETTAATPGRPTQHGDFLMTGRWAARWPLQLPWI